MTVESLEPVRNTVTLPDRHSGLRGPD
jgi:hypothetical protein